ncbi:MAG: hypothetical protein KC619_36135, partial [Myxococcales bacterium]|nr:hypothetical protein [Myxococcales bacterium]
AGEGCAATTCTTAADCSPRGLHAQGLDYVATDRSVCREVALCVLEEQYQLGGLWPEEPPTRTRRIGRGACVDGQCPAGGECETALRCVPAPEPTPTAPPRAPAEESTPGCAVGPRAAPTFAMLIALAAIVTAGARRTRRPRR